MFLGEQSRKAIAILFYWPFVTCAVTKFVIAGLFKLRHRSRHGHQRHGNLESLCHTGMSGRFSGTIATFFAKRADVQSWLPPELTIVEKDRLPEWLRDREDQPAVLIFGKQTSLGKRRLFLGRYRTVPLFRPYLEAFVAIPFLKPKASGGPSPCFHFVRVPCSTFWPTELGKLCFGWPKIQCRMRMSEQGETQHYSIEDEGGSIPLLRAETDLTGSVALDHKQDCLDKVISMLSQPLVLIRGQELLFFSFDLRFEAAALKTASASVTVYPGFLSAAGERMDFSFPSITDGDFGAFFIETTFMNRLVERKRRLLSRRPQEPTRDGVRQRDFPRSRPATKASS